ncbi:MAG: hypothetical protein JJU45_05955 [Acidimicrobiia bacterium]|nr:hypothetical protein [Acidimicrobiia bacterium]
MDRRRAGMVRRLVVVAVLAAMALAATACGGDDSGDTPQDAVPTTDPTPEVTPTDDDSGGDDVVGDELPDPDEFEGEVRLLNLYVDDEGTSMDVDLWAVRSFTHGPSLLVAGLGPGEVSEYVAAPAGQSLTVVPSGRTPDDADSDLGGLFNPSDGELITGILTWSDGTSTVASIWDRSVEDRSGVEPPPADDQALVIIRAGQLSAHEDALADTYGGRSFHVGDGSGACLAQQRMEAEGFSPAVLGGTNPTVHEVSPGTVTISFHEWPGDSDCEQDPVLGPFDVDTSAGETTLVVLWTPDLETIEVLTLPVG